MRPVRREGDRNGTDPGYGAGAGFEAVAWAAAVHGDVADEYAGAGGVSQRTGVGEPGAGGGGAGQGQDTWEAFASQVPWLGDTPWTGQTAQEGDWGRGESPTESLAFLLEEQLARRGLSPELLAVCRYLAGLLDDDGRLDPEDLAGLRTAGVPAELLERGVEVLQSLEPAGVGARSLEECLLLQLRRLPGEHTVAQAICQGHLEELSKEHYGALARRLGVTQRQVEAAAREIRALSPSPVGEGAEPSAVPFIRRMSGWRRWTESCGFLSTSGICPSIR